MRVLLVNDFYVPHVVGGAETLVRTLAIELLARGHTVTVCTARVKGLASREEIEGIEVLRIGSFPGFQRSVRVASGSSPARPTSSLSDEFQGLLREFAPDAVHFHNAWLLGPRLMEVASRYCRVGVSLHDYWPICVRRSMIRLNGRPCPGSSPLACSACRMRAAATLRSLNLAGIKPEYKEHARILGACAFVTAPSRFLAARVGEETGAPITVVYNGVAAPHNALGDNRQSPAGCAEPYVLFASRPTAEKGYQVALRAFSLSALKNYTLAVAGDPPGHAGEIPANVRVLGKQSPAEMLPLIAGASCVVVPSIWPENCPMIILEALAAGVPIVASRIGGIPELIEDGVTGLLIEPSSPDSLAAGVLRACTDKSLRASARHQGPTAVRERFSLPVMTARFEALYAA